MRRYLCCSETGETRMDPYNPIPSFGKLGIPAIGIGTYELRGQECVAAVREAIRIGFRLIDTAAVYRNEEFVGDGIRQSGVAREKLFVVVKIAMKTMGDEARLRQGVLKSIENLGVGYADCVLVHWPGCGGLKPNDRDGHVAARSRCWRVLCSLKREGLVHSMGVSNFLPRHFAEVDAVVQEEGGAIEYRPVLNQIELNPLCVQEDVVQYCRDRGMLLQQYSPLGKRDPRLVAHDELVRLQTTCFPNFSREDVLHLWGLSQGFSLLTRSRSVKHLQRNWDVAVMFFARQSPSYRACTSPVSSDRVLTPLTDAQRRSLLELRNNMLVKDDVHFCWWSSEIE